MPEARFEQNGYYSEVGPFRIPFVDSSKQLLLGPDWLLDNWMSWANGLPRRALGGEPWTVRLRVDPAGDGRYTFTAQVPKFDLYWTERQTGAVIFVRTLPLARRASERDLSVLAHDWTEEIAGGEWSAACLGGCAVGEVRHYATSILSEELTFVAGVGAYDLTFDIANVDQLQINPDARALRARLVLVRPGYRMALTNDDRRYDVVALVVLGYAQTPDRFDEHLPEFEDLLDRIDFWPGGVPTDIGPR